MLIPCTRFACATEYVYHAAAAIFAIAGSRSKTMTPWSIACAGTSANENSMALTAGIAAGTTVFVATGVVMTWCAARHVEVRPAENGLVVAAHAELAETLSAKTEIHR